MPRKLNELEKQHFVVPLALDDDQLIRFHIRPGRHFSLSVGLPYPYIEPEASVIDEPEEKTAQIVLRYLNTSDRMKNLTQGVAIYSYKGPFQQLHLSIFTWQGDLIFEQYYNQRRNNL